MFDFGVWKAYAWIKSFGQLQYQKGGLQEVMSTTCAQPRGAFSAMAGRIIRAQHKLIPFICPGFISIG